jgi:hypothetical protein
LGQVVKGDAMLLADHEQSTSTRVMNASLLGLASVSIDDAPEGPIVLTVIPSMTGVEVTRYRFKGPFEDAVRKFREHLDEAARKGGGGEYVEAGFCRVHVGGRRAACWNESPPGIEPDRFREFWQGEFHTHAPEVGEGED